MFSEMFSAQLLNGYGKSMRVVDHILRAHHTCKK
jgi:hypothetical protein